MQFSNPKIIFLFCVTARYKYGRHLACSWKQTSSIRIRIQLMLEEVNPWTKYDNLLLSVGMYEIL